MKDIYEIINNIYPLDKSLVDEVFPLLEEQTVKKGDLVMYQDKVCQDLFIIREGVFRNFVIRDGKDITRWFAEEGDIFTSVLSFVHGEPSIASVEALCPSKVYKIELTAVRTIIDSSLEWIKWVNHLVMDGLSVMERRYKYLGTGDAYTRFCNFYKWRSQDTIRHIPLQHIATYLNVSPQTISRFRRRLIRER